MASLILLGLSWWVQSRSRSPRSRLRAFAIWFAGSALSMLLFLFLLNFFANVGRPPETQQALIEATWWAKALCLAGPALGAILGYVRGPRGLVDSAR